MQPSTVTGPSSLRLNPHSRSLRVSFSRPYPKQRVQVVLFDHNLGNQKFNLQVLSSDNQGVDIKIPHLLSGIYCIRVSDGNTEFTSQVAIQ